MADDRVDVAIVGGGGNGLPLACLLVDRGLTVRVFERRAYGEKRLQAVIL